MYEVKEKLTHEKEDKKKEKTEKAIFCCPLFKILVYYLSPVWWPLQNHETPIAKNDGKYIQLLMKSITIIMHLSANLFCVGKNIFL